MQLKLLPPSRRAGLPSSGVHLPRRAQLRAQLRALARSHPRRNETWDGRKAREKRLRQRRAERRQELRPARRSRSHLFASGRATRAKTARQAMSILPRVLRCFQCPRRLQRPSRLLCRPRRMAPVAPALHRTAASSFPLSQFSQCSRRRQWCRMSRPWAPCRCRCSRFSQFSRCRCRSLCLEE